MEFWIFSLSIFVLFQFYQGKLSIPKAILTAKPVLLLFFTFLSWNVLQITPIPISILEVISPYAAELAKIQGLDLASIAIDSDFAIKSLLKSFSFTLLLLLMLVLINTTRKIKWFGYTVLAAALFQAAYSSLMVLTGLEYSFFFEKEFHIGSATGTFINRNHLAGYLEIALAIGIGLMISKLNSKPAYNWRDRIRRLLHFLLSPKVIIRLMLIIIYIGLILSHSRMGNTAFFISLLISGLFFLQSKNHVSRAASKFISTLIILDVLLIGSWVGINKVIDRIEDTTLKVEQRDEVIRDTLTLILQQPFTGIGGNNFFSVFPTYQQDDITHTYSHTHNDYLEFLAEFGIIGFSLLAGAVLYCLLLSIKTMRQAKTPLLLGMAFAGFMGILSILIHSAVDFNLQIPANAAMFILLMGLCIISASMRHQKRTRV